MSEDPLGRDTTVPERHSRARIPISALLEELDRCGRRVGVSASASCDAVDVCLVCRICAAVERGAVLGVPTESSYGLAVDPSNEVAVSRVFEIKGRADTAPLLVVAACGEQLKHLGLDLDHPLARRALEAWPAPLTVVLPSPADLPAQRGLPTLAVRVPAFEPLRRLLERTGPLTATSANRSGEPASSDPREVAELLADTDSLVIDAGELRGGAPSTLLGWNEGEGVPVVLRQGAWHA